MDELATGRRDKRGQWRPLMAAAIAPVFVWPPRPAAFLRWLPSYFLPWNLLFLATGAAFWLWLTPPLARMAVLDPVWPALILLRNAAAVALFYGAIEVWLYVRRRQGTRFKYNPAFPADKPNAAFWWSSQTRDTIARTFLSGVPIWTAWEVLALYAFASGWSPMSTFTDNPLWLLVIALLVPVFHHVHFYLIHRLIHLPALYRSIHSVHHNSVNPTPWSSLAMHPVEHLVYFSGVAVHLLIGSHPLLAIYHLHFAGLGAAVGHIGFHTVETGAQKGVDTHAFTHYLHHKYFEVNYGEGLVPLDKWFGTWHDGSAAADRLMEARHVAKVAQTNRAR